MALIGEPKLVAHTILGILDATKHRFGNCEHCPCDPELEREWFDGLMIVVVSHREIEDAKT